MSVIIYSLFILLIFGLCILLMDVLRSAAKDGGSVLTEILISITPQYKQNLEEEFDKFMKQKD